MAETVELARDGGRIAKNSRYFLSSRIAKSRRITINTELQATCIAIRAELITIEDQIRADS